MDNQQGNRNDTELAWLSGFFDGEGSVGFHRVYVPTVKNCFYSPRIRLCNTDYGVLEKVFSILKGHGLAFRIDHKIPKVEYHKKHWTISVLGLKRCKRFCEAMLRHCLVKHQELLDMWKFCNSRLSRNRKSIYNNLESDIIRSFLKYRRGPHRLDAEPPKMKGVMV